MDWGSKEHISSMMAMMRAKIYKVAQHTTISQQQKGSLRAPRIKGPMWVAKFAFPAPQDDELRQLLFQVINDMENSTASNSYTRPQSVTIQLEWTGFRKGVDEDEPEPSISESEKFSRLMEDSPTRGAVLFLYGGAFYMNSQATYRQITSKLSRLTGLPCVTVHQRLAPQSPFPAALLDVFHGYMSLLSPAANAPHAQFSASSIVLAGDSSGGCLALSLIQVLLTLKRKGVSSVLYNGREVELALPAGLTLLSTVAELTHSLPSYEENIPYDMFPPGPPAAALPDFPACELWPTDPPRGNPYCDVSMFTHPITCPIMADDWTGSPPLWFTSGQEQVVDGVKAVARIAFRQEVSVHFEEYEAMPHCFMWRLPQDCPQYRRCWDEWAKVCKKLVTGRGITSGAEFIQVKGLESRQVEIEDLNKLTPEQSQAVIRKVSKIQSTYTGPRSTISKL